MSSRFIASTSKSWIAMNVWPITSNCHASMLLVTQVFQERLLGSRQWPDSMMTIVKWCQMMANGTTLTTWKKHRHCVLGKVQYGDQDDLQQQKPHNFAAPWSQLKSQNDHETLGPHMTQFRDYVMTTSCYSHLLTRRPRNWYLHSEPESAAVMRQEPSVSARQTMRPGPMVISSRFMKLVFLPHI